MSALLEMDNTYASRTALRKQLLRTRPQDVLAHTPAIGPAVREFYTWITGTYLPRRFPTLYTLSGSGLRNHVLDETMPLAPADTTQALTLLGEHIDTDFLFLLPIPPLSSPSSPSPDPDAGKYRLEGFITCFPSGFRTANKLGLKLADIHGPVPSYKERLERSMDRFFAGLPVGRVVRRGNWSVTTTRELCLMGGTHLSAEEMAEVRERERGRGGEEKEREEGEDKEKIDIEDTVLRCERQTLHRLPASGALVFGYKTYQYEMAELREEGCGEEFAAAIEGLGKGNAPGMRLYKREVVWGDEVRRYMRGESW
jgi:hypothetical protein